MHRLAIPTRLPTIWRPKTSRRVVQKRHCLISAPAWQTIALSLVNLRRHAFPSSFAHEVCTDPLPRMFSHLAFRDALVYALRFCVEFFAAVLSHTVDSKVLR